MPYNVEVKKNVALSRAKIFAALTDFGGVAKILPEAVKTCTLVGSGVGSVRNIVLADGGTVSERLEMAHNQSVFAYSITANTALPVENYFACVTLADGANGSTDVVWASNWTAKGATEAEIKPMLEGLYTALLDGIAKAG